MLIILDNAAKLFMFMSRFYVGQSIHVLENLCSIIKKIKLLVLVLFSFLIFGLQHALFHISSLTLLNSIYCFSLRELGSINFDFSVLFYIFESICF